MRSASLCRSTKETDVTVELTLDSEPRIEVRTGIAMLDHLLAQLAFHGSMDCTVRARSLDGILHHLVEDVAVVLGRTLDAALGDRSGIVRFGSALVPMDDALVRAAVDLGGRAYARTELGFRGERIEGLDTILIPHVVRSLADNARLTVHVDRLAGDDPHHVAEAAFKALGRALAEAWTRDPRFSTTCISTKGTIR
jgi:imidazoleglycerol-phosphate dehydratase